MLDHGPGHPAAPPGARGGLVPAAAYPPGRGQHSALGRPHRLGRDATADLGESGAAGPGGPEHLAAGGTLHEECEAFFDLARDYPATALQLLRIFTFRSRTLEEFEAERRFLIDAGVPEAFLPDAAGCGRADLLPCPH
ncbi:hypothetical protein [Nonomuraea sp. NPDC049750]|uniref:hypothetical protein n=1 Tax=Nonomuraea sp. NPDC049750 TaxID=3154738 RepID=UPI0033EFC15F